MEMLIVVAIIAILVAIAIPTFSTALEKAREAADIANIRSAYATAMLNYIDGTVDATTGAATATSEKMVQQKSGWDYVTWPAYLGTSVDVTKGTQYTVTIAADGTVTVAAASSSAS